VAALALYLLNLDLIFHMPDKINYIHVTAGTGIFAMNRCGKRADRNFIAVASQAGGRIYGHSLLG
jgi:hypothetical protein